MMIFSFMVIVSFYVVFVYIFTIEKKCGYVELSIDPKSQ